MMLLRVMLCESSVLSLSLNFLSSVSRVSRRGQRGRIRSKLKLTLCSPLFTDPGPFVSLQRRVRRLFVVRLRRTRKELDWLLLESLGGRCVWCREEGLERRKWKKEGMMDV